jgi:hypothetical protein
MADDTNSALKLIAQTQQNIDEELRQHRQLFSDLRDAMHEQKASQTVLATSITGLSKSIDRHEQVVERVIDIENWRKATRVDLRIERLEDWRNRQELNQAKIKGQMVVIIAVAGAAISLVAYAVGKAIDFFLK